MTDYPRFEAVKGLPDTTYRHHDGARLVDLVRERPPQSAPSAERSARDELVQAHARLARQFPDETFPRDFIVGGAPTRKLQAALLAVLVAGTVTLVVLQFNSAGLSSRQIAQHPGSTSRGSLPGIRDRNPSADASPPLAAGERSGGAGWLPPRREARP